MPDQAQYSEMWNWIRTVEQPHHLIPSVKLSDDGSEEMADGEEDNSSRSFNDQTANILHSTQRFPRKQHHQMSGRSLSYLETT